MPVKRIEVARSDIRLLDMTSLGGRDPSVEAFVIPTVGDPVVMETHDPARFDRWIRALDAHNRPYRIAG